MLILPASARIVWDISGVERDGVLNSIFIARKYYALQYGFLTMSQVFVHGETGDGSLKINTDVLIALGSNLTSPSGAPSTTLSVAFELLKEKGVLIRRRSPMFRTPAFPPGAGPDFANAAAQLEVPGTPEQILAILHEVEAEMGRVRGKRWGQRTLDLDLIAVGAAVLPDTQTHARWRALPLERQMAEAPDQLILPHPRVQDRAFVLVPLAEVAPDWRHPVLDRTVRQMMDDLPQADRDSVVKMQ